jgi:hypothetical protein
MRRTLAKAGVKAHFMGQTGVVAALIKEREYARQ